LFVFVFVRLIDSVPRWAMESQLVLVLIDADAASH